MTLVHRLSRVLSVAALGAILSMTPMGHRVGLRAAPGSDPLTTMTTLTVVAGQTDRIEEAIKNIRGLSEQTCKQAIDELSSLLDKNLNDAEVQTALRSIDAIEKIVSELLLASIASERDILARHPNMEEDLQVTIKTIMATQEGMRKQASSIIALIRTEIRNKKLEKEDIEDLRKIGYGVCSTTTELQIK